MVTHRSSLGSICRTLRSSKPPSWTLRLQLLLLFTVSIANTRWFLSFRLTSKCVKIEVTVISYVFFHRLPLYFERVYQFVCLISSRNNNCLRIHWSIRMKSEKKKLLSKRLVYSATISFQLLRNLSCGITLTLDSLQMPAKKDFRVYFWRLKCSGHHRM